MAALATTQHADMPRPPITMPMASWRALVRLSKIKVMARLAVATDGAAENSPEKALGRAAWPIREKTTTRVPPARARRASTPMVVAAPSSAGPQPAGGGAVVVEALDEVDHGPLLGAGHEPGVVDEGAHQLQSPTPFALGAGRSRRQGLVVEAVARVYHPDLRRLRAQGEGDLVGIGHVGVLDHVGRRLAHGQEHVGDVGLANADLVEGVADEVAGEGHRLAVTGQLEGQRHPE